MFRVFSLLLIVLALPSCAIGPRSSTFAGLNSRDDDAPARAPAVSAAPQNRTQQAGLGSSLSGWWDSVKSGFGSDDGNKSATPSLQGPPFDPVTATKMVNAYRAQKGLKPLKLNTKLSEAARKHSEDLAKSDRISHYGSDGSDAWDRVRKAGYGPRITAENVGTGQQSLEEVFRGWQKSKDHNANLLLGEAEEMGVAMVYKPDSQFKTFWTMVVASPRIN
jgi:uncharacterized protein YkwD